MPLPHPVRYFLEDYLSPCFVETGSHRGDGIAHALAAGFGCVYSCDVSPFAYGWCCHRFRDQRHRVHLYLADSRDFLGRILDEGVCAESPCTFYLDAHWCGGDGEMDGHEIEPADDSPVLEELRIIGAHPVRTHTIFIDDVRMFGLPHFPPTLEQVTDALLAINPAYDVRLVDSRDFPRDILVATVP